MSKHRVKNLTKSSLVASRFLKEAEQCEWSDIPPSLDDAALDAGALNNLWVRCALCNMNVTQPCKGFLMCPDCGSEIFEVRRLLIRRNFVMNPLGLRLTGGGGNYFLHVNVPANIAAGSLHYELNGGYPTSRSGCYRHPIHLKDKTQEVRLRYFTHAEEQSQIFYWRAALTCVCGKEVALQEGTACECPECHSVYVQKKGNAEWERDARLSKKATPAPAPPPKAEPTKPKETVRKKLILKKVERPKPIKQSVLRKLSVRLLLLLLLACFVAYWYHADISMDGLSIFEEPAEEKRARQVQQDIAQYAEEQNEEEVRLFEQDAQEEGAEAQEHLKEPTSIQKMGEQSNPAEETDYERAVSYYEKKDYKQAVKLFKREAKENHAGAQYYLGRCYEAGHGGARNKKESLKWYRKAAAQEHAEAKAALKRLVRLDREEKVLPEPSAAQSLYKRGCLRYSKKDYAEAVRLFTQAAQQKHTGAQYLLGLCYDLGQGVKVNRETAFAWYCKAANQGHAPAQNNVGLCFQHGYGTRKDASRAYEWYSKAAVQGYAAAQNNLGLCYQEAQGVGKDDIKAFEWYRKAALQQYAEAQYRLGRCYEHGCGVRINKNAAAKWYQKALMQGYNKAKKALQNL